MEPEFVLQPFNELEPEIQKLLLLVLDMIDALLEDVKGKPGTFSKETGDKIAYTYLTLTRIMTSIGFKPQ